MQSRGGYQRGKRTYSSRTGEDSDYGHKKRHFDQEDDLDSAEKFVMQIGEKSDEDFTFAADHLLLNYSASRDKIMNALEVCISEIPAKSITYARLAIAMNKRNPEFVQELLMNLIELLEIRFKRADFDQVLLIMRFFSLTCAAGIVSLSSMLKTLSELVEFGQQNGEQIKYAILRSVLPSLPFIMDKIQEKAADFVASFLETLQLWMNSFSKEPVQMTPEIVQWDPLSASWQAFLQLQQNNWQFEIALLPSNEEIVAEHDLRSFKLNIFNQNQQLANFPFISLEFPVNENEKPISLFEKLLLWDNARITVQFFSLNCKRGLETVLNEMKSSSLEREYTFAFFSCLLGSGLSGEKTIKYLVSMIMLCRMRPSIAPFLGRIIRYFYSNCETLDNHILFFFYDWMTEQLVNFDLKWNWAEWTSDGLINPSKKLFIEEILDRLSRNLYVDRIKNALPESFCSLVAETCEKNFNEDMYKDPSVQELVAKVRSRQRFEEIFPNETTLSHSTFSSFVRAILIAGSATISHSIAFLDLHKKSLTQMINQNPEFAQLLMQELCTFWMHNVQVIEVLTQKLVLYKIVNPTALLRAFLAVTKNEELIKFKMWNIVFNILDIINLRISQCKERIIEIRKDFAEDFINEEIAAINKAIAIYIPEKEEFLTALADIVESIRQGTDNPHLSKTLKAIQAMISKSK